MGRAKRGAGVGLTGLGEVGALRDGPWIRVRGAGSSWVPSAGLEVGARGFGDARLGVEAEELLVLSSRGVGSTLQLATQVARKFNLPVNCSFASTLDRRLDLPFEVKPSKAWGLGGEDGLPPLGCRHPCHSLRATLSSSPMVFAASGGGRDVRVFRLAVLPAHPTHVPVLVKIMATQGGEDRPRQDRPSFLPIPKGQGWKVRVIAHPHSGRAP